MVSKLHKTAKARHELAAGIRTLNQRERTVLLLSDGKKSVQDFHRQLGPVAAKVAQDLIQGGYLEEKADTFAVTVPAPLTEILSQPARGIPAAPAPMAAQARANVEPDLSASVTRSIRPERSVSNLLVVDDSEVALKAMRLQLSRFSATVHFAASGESALALLPKYDFQIVFLDVMMAGLDGYQTCRAIKNCKTRSGHVPAVVMLTSRGGVVDKIRGAMARCDAYLTKPIHKGDLLAVMLQFASASAATLPDLAETR